MAADVIVKIGADNSDFKRSWGEAERLVSSGSSSMTRSISAIGGAIAAAFSVTQLAQFSKSVFDLGVSLDSANRAFVAITGSQQAARQEFEFLRATAEKTGQNFYELIDSYKRLTAATDDTALQGEETRKIFTSLTSAASVLGLSNDRVKMAFEALAQMASKGTVSMEELRQQLGDHIPGAVNLAAKAMDMTTAEFIKLVSAGKVAADDLLPKLSAEFQRLYGVAAETAALESAQAAVNRMSQAWTEFKANLFDSDAAVAAINQVTEALKLLNAVINGWNADGIAFEKLGAEFSAMGDIVGAKSEQMRIVMSDYDAQIVETTDKLRQAKEAVQTFYDAGLDNDHPIMQSALKGVEDVGRELEDLRSKAGETSSGIVILGDSYKQTVPQVQAYSQATGEASEASGKAAKSAKQLADDTEKVGREMLAAAYKRWQATDELEENLQKARRDRAKEEVEALKGELQEQYRASADAYDKQQQQAAAAAQFIQERWTEAYDGMQGILADWIRNWEISLDSILDLFLDMLAEMVAAWLMNMARMAATAIWNGEGMAGVAAAFSSSTGGGGGASLVGLGSAAYTAYTGESMLATGASYLGIGGTAAAGGSAAVGEAGFGMYSSGSVYASQAAAAGAAAGAEAGAAAGTAYAAQIASTSYTAGAGATSYATFQTASTGAGGAASGGAAGSTGAGLSGGAIGLGVAAAVMAGIYLLSQKDPKQYMDSPTYGYKVGVKDRGEDDYADAMANTHAVIGAYQNSPESGFDVVGAMGTLDILANSFGDMTAKMSLSLDGTVASTDVFLDSMAGYDVSMEQSSSITDLAAQAAHGNVEAMELLRGNLHNLGLTEDEVAVATLGLISATDGMGDAAANVAGSLGEGESAAISMTQSVDGAAQAFQSGATAAQGMAAAVANFSATPLTIQYRAVGMSADGYSYASNDHASGGIFTRPTLLPSVNGRMHRVGEAGAEAITPLHAGPDTLAKMDAKIDAIASRPVVINFNGDAAALSKFIKIEADSHVVARNRAGLDPNQRAVY
jgi:tape measure domain-containing protein